MKKEVQGRKLTDVIGRVKALHNTWRFRKICFDATGLGADPADQFEESGLPIDTFEFNLKTKQDIYENLQLIIEQSEMGGRVNDKK
ncbi:MAG: hypothetical protein GTN80_04360 [Nitrososphaeria archaeon]|nr:hypothetical protein [Nitrososphaeria archaeon]NIN52373.1 hypothetical protein [Nitrososphaeria archaeon]NIQ32861.1 hypothetical protein [Nitrososphaeria archaeon]